MPLFYQIRSKGESETQRFLGVWLFVGISACSLGPYEKLKTGLFDLIFLGRNTENWSMQ